jgi:hypothetical protein
LRRYNPGIRSDFSLSYAPFEKPGRSKCWKHPSANWNNWSATWCNRTRLSANQPDPVQELAQAKDENESLQLSLMEQEEKHGATAARIQALVDRVNAGPVSA